MLILAPGLVVLCIGLLAWGIRSKRWALVLGVSLPVIGMLGFLVFQVVQSELHNRRQAEAWPIYEQALKLYTSGNEAASLEKLNQALETQPSLSEAALLRGDIHWKQGKVEDAIADYTLALEHSSHRQNGLVLKAYLDRSQCYKQLNRQAEAEADLEKAKELSPGLFKK